MPPQNVDMSLIREALARRQAGGGAPAVDQMSQPTASLPTGGPNTPGVRPPQPQPQAPQSVGPREVNSTVKAATQANTPQFDDETRVIAKALVAKLLKAL